VSDRHPAGDGHHKHRPGGPTGHPPEPRPCSSEAEAPTRPSARVRRTPARIHAADPVIGAGVTALLRPRPEVVVLPDGGDPVDAWVGVVVADDLDEAALEAPAGCGPPARPGWSAWRPRPPPPT
jgi:hypothetical protein